MHPEETAIINITIVKVVRRGSYGTRSPEKTSEKEERLLKMIRDLKFGEIHIYVADGQPVRAEEIRKSVKF